MAKLVLRAGRASAVPALVLTFAVALTGCGEEGGPSLVCYVADPLCPAVEELGRLYKAQTGLNVQIQGGDAGTLLGEIEKGRKADLFACYDPFAAALESKKLSGRIWVVASLTPAIAVARGNPKRIQGLRDLARSGLRVGLPDEATPLGRLCAVLFRKAGIAGTIEASAVARSGSGGELADAVAKGDLDAALVWSPTTNARRKRLEAVTVEARYRPRPRVDAIDAEPYGRLDLSSIAVTLVALRGAPRSADAAAFAEFAASPQGRAVLASHGLSPSPEMGPVEARRRGTTTRGRG